MSKKIMEKIILTDADGVLVYWNGAFERFMERKGHPRIPGTDDEYNISLRHKNVSPSEAHAFVKEFNESEYIANIEPFADSVKYVKKLSELGFRFTVVTSISDAPAAKYYRTKNLINVFGDIFDDIICIEMGASKAATLQKWLGTGYFWIEDHMRQAEAGHEAGLKTILIDHPYNTHYHTDLFPKVSYEKPWEEIYNIICREYNIEI